MSGKYNVTYLLLYSICLGLEMLSITNMYYLYVLVGICLTSKRRLLCFLKFLVSKDFFIKQQRLKLHATQK